VLAPKGPALRAHEIQYEQEALENGRVLRLRCLQLVQHGCLASYVLDAWRRPDPEAQHAAGRRVARMAALQQPRHFDARAGSGSAAPA